MTAPELSQHSEHDHRILVVGMGSAHGDDRVGWEVIDALQKRSLRGIELRATAVPLDLLDWISDDCLLHIVDACDGAQPPGHLARWDWCQPGRMKSPEQLFALRGSGTHDFGTVEVLQLAEQLRRLPEHVTIWGIQGARFANSETLSPPVADRLAEITNVIAKELTHARTITGAVAADAG